MSADNVAVQNRHLPAAFHQEDGEDLGDGRLSGSTQPRKPNATTPLVQWRRDTRQDSRSLGSREPVREYPSVVQIMLPDLRPGYGGRFHTGRNSILLFIAIFLRQIDHLFERDHLDADLGFKPLQQLLRVVGSVKGFSLRVLSGSGVISTNDEMVDAVVSPDDRVPDRLARSTHPHGQRQQA